MRKNQSTIRLIWLCTIFMCFVFLCFTGVHFWRINIESKKQCLIIEEARNSLGLYYNSFNKRLEKALEENDSVKAKRYAHYVDAIKDAYKVIDKLTQFQKPYLNIASLLKKDSRTFLQVYYFEKGFRTTGIKLYDKDTGHLIASFPIIRSYENFSEKEKKEYELVATRWNRFNVIIESNFRYDEKTNEIEIPESLLAKDVLVGLYSLEGQESNKVKLYIDPNLQK